MIYTVIVWQFDKEFFELIILKINMYKDNIISFCVSYDLIAKVVKIIFFSTKGCLIDGLQYAYIERKDCRRYLWERYTM